LHHPHLNSGLSRETGVAQYAHVEGPEKDAMGVLLTRRLAQPWGCTPQLVQKAYV
jgi:hypothetical protein